MSKGIPFLMYHEIRSPGRDLCNDNAGYVRYVVDEHEFKRQLSMIISSGWRGWNVSQALSVLNSGDHSERGVCITFDDGCATDLLIAAQLLLERHLNATFYVTVNHLGKRGYLTPAQLIELADLGFEIGSHSLNHCHLNDLKLSEVEVELGESQKQLEDIIGCRVVHFSCPGGRTSAVIKQVARDTGYESVATSKIGLNTAKTEHYALSRIAVKKGLKAEALAGLCRGEKLLLSRAQDLAFSAAKRVLGNSVYERVRSAALR